MNVTLADLAVILEGDLVGDGNGAVTNVAIDSRSVRAGSAFFALKGSRSDGHAFVSEAFNAGAVVAVVSRTLSSGFSHGGGESFIVVDEPLRALQRLAGWWRSSWTGSVIGITGSFGKTSVKECLAHILSSLGATYESPGSFNSQIGVPLSILRAETTHQFSVLEVGISEPGEMSPLAEVLQPTCGILTNVGPAHIFAFGSESEILSEKMRLFSPIPPEGWVILPASDLGDFDLECRIYRQGSPELPFVEERTSTSLATRFPEGELVHVPLSRDSVHHAANVELSMAAAYLLGATAEQIVRALEDYKPVSTRLETWRSSSGLTVISNTHGPDLMSIQAALDHMQTVSSPSARKFFVFNASEGDTQVRKRAVQSGVDEIVDSLKSARELLATKLRWGDVVVVHDQSKSGIDAVARDLIGAMAPNRLYVDLQAIQENIHRIQKHVGPNTKILAMVKALAYGTEVSHFASAIRNMGVSGFGVSSADEGISLRKEGVEGEILVMLCTPSEAEKVIEYGLTPVVYSREVLMALTEAARKASKVVEVHLEVDTGMGRTGLLPEMAVTMALEIAASGVLRLTGLMTHFASADSERHDDSTRAQITAFRKVCLQLEQQGMAKMTLHAAATSAAARFPEAHLDMVRIGIGLYGVDPSPAVRQALRLSPAVSLVSRISRIQSYQRGSQIGYGGTYTVDRDDFRGAIVPIGYHDGVPWSSSNQGVVLVSGCMAPIAGRISMDSMMIDVSDISGAEQGSDVLIFGRFQGHELPVEEVARRADTFAYELLARVGPRVQRIFLSV